MGPLVKVDGAPDSMAFLVCFEHRAVYGQVLLGGGREGRKKHRNGRHLPAFSSALPAQKKERKVKCMTPDTAVPD